MLQTSLRGKGILYSKSNGTKIFTTSTTQISLGRRSFSQVRPAPTLHKSHALSSVLSNTIKQSLKTNISFKRNISSTTANEKLRNVAIIAHVDHGKTTLVDELLKQSGSGSTVERVMDSNTLEKERGITITAKNTSIGYQEFKINLVDTPGHGDFGGEVERMMGMVDGVVLLVDAAEGVMTQTKFVLSKALKAGLKPIVVLNKMDRTERVRIDEVESEIFDLFFSLGASEAQMEYPTLYASGRSGWAIKKRDDERKNLEPLFESIINYVPPPKKSEETKFAMAATTLETDTFMGRMLTGRVTSGKVAVGEPLKALDSDGKVIEETKVTKIFARKGLERIILDEASEGDIVTIAGFTTASVSHTLCHPEITTPLKTIPIDPPVLSMQFAVNTSPLAGTEGKQCTFPTIKRRLQKEVENNVSITLKHDQKSEALEVCGRGELQLGVLIENMRREGFEFSVYPPQVVIKTDENGKRLEPLEEVIIDVDDQYMGSIIEKMSIRKADMIEMKQTMGKTRLVFHCPSRALLGFRSELMTETRGTAVFNHIFHSYVEYRGKLDSHKRGAIISIAEGVTTTYALSAIEARGTLFVSPNTKVFPGMVIGESSKEGDLEVNPVKAKALTNFRTVQKEDNVRLTPPKIMTLEEYISYLRHDECLEVTPTSIRLRKVLNSLQRKKAAQAEY